MVSARKRCGATCQRSKRVCPKICTFWQKVRLSFCESGISRNPSFRNRIGLSKDVVSQVGQRNRQWWAGNPRHDEHRCHIGAQDSDLREAWCHPRISLRGERRGPEAKRRGKLGTTPAAPLRSPESEPGASPPAETSEQPSFPECSPPPPRSTSDGHRPELTLPPRSSRGNPRNEKQQKQTCNLLARAAESRPRGGPRVCLDSLVRDVHGRGDHMVCGDAKGSGDAMGSGGATSCDDPRG